MTTHTAATTSTHPPRDRQETVVESSRPATPALPPEGVTLKDVFRLEDIQCIQDAFAEASNVAALITDLQGVPLTRPSHFTAYCQLIRSTKRGLEHCLVSDAAMYRSCREGPVARHCASAGLLDGGTGIYFENQHIANWLVGQVIDPSTDIDGCVAYATDLGIDADVARAALDQVPRMSRERFGAICQALHRFANHLSALAVDNYRQSQLITDLRSAQDSVRERDRNIADIIDFLPDPTVILDQTGTVTFWNRAMEKMTGVAAVDMLGKADFAYGVPFYGTPTPLLVDYARGAIAHPDTRYAVATLDEDAVIAEVEVVALPGGSRHVWAKAVALRDATGSIIGAIETIRDVTDRHRTEMALRESEAMFRRIVETAHEGVWVFDATYKTSFVNRRMAAMLGYTPEEMVGAPLEDFVPGHQMERLRHQQQRRRQGQSDVFELQFATKSGALIWVLISASPLYDASGTFIGALGMFTDITDRKRVEDALANQRQRLEADVEERTRDLQLQALELAEANIRLSELDRMKSVFLSTVSHELRTPLTSILGFAKLIGREFADQFLPLATGNNALETKGRRIRHNLGVVFSEAERLTRLINDVLDLNRIESGNIEWRDQRIAPLPILEKAAQSVVGLLEQRPDVSFTFEAAPDVPELFMDPDQLMQVVSNLLNNAVKFTTSGNVRLEVRGEDQHVLIAVRDSGIGIPADELELIFEKFHQVGRGDTVNTVTKGTGLGLAISRQIVRHYGGSIWAESALGRGSVFCVRLPAAPPQEEEKA